MSRVDTIDLELTVLMADGLAPKDTKLFGKQTEVFMCISACSYVSHSFMFCPLKG